MIWSGAVPVPGRDRAVDVLEVVRHMAAHPLTVAVVPLVGPCPPVLLADTLLDDPADLPDRGVTLDEDVHVAETLAVQEGKALLGEHSARVLDVLHFAVVGFLVLHIRWFWFPDTKVGTKNETYVRQTNAENLFIKAGAKSRPEGDSSGGHSGSRP